MFVSAVGTYEIKLEVVLEEITFTHATHRVQMKIQHRNKKNRSPPSSLASLSEKLLLCNRYPDREARAYKKGDDN